MNEIRDDEIIFILCQSEEIGRHKRYLEGLQGRRSESYEVACDWIERYAAAFREVGEMLLLKMGRIPGRVELFQLGMAEIMRHKWILSRLADRDVGLKAAGENWLAEHFEGWLQSTRSAG
jgi:hypothetical protein